MDAKLAKLAIACLICLSVITGIVIAVEHFAGS